MMTQMELCSLEDAFPKIEIHNHTERKEFPEGKSTPSREERKAARKKAKRCKGPALQYLEAQDSGSLVEQDPDRQGFKRLGEVPAFVSYADAFPDISGSIEAFKLPKLPSSNCLITEQGLPSYFGKGLDDEEGFANYSSAKGDNPGYELIPGTLAGFEEKTDGAAATGEGASSLPAPSISNSWKPLTAAKTTTAFTGSRNIERVEPNLPETPARVHDAHPTKKEAPVATTGSREHVPGPEDVAREKLIKQIQELKKRLDDLEHKEPPRNTQKELLMFIGSGLFLLVSFDLVLRAGGRR